MGDEKSGGVSRYGVRIGEARAYGNFTMRITQPLLFVNTIVATKGVFTTEGIAGYLRDVIVSRLNDFLGEHMKSIVDLPQNYDELSVVAKVRLKEDFAKYGMELIDFFVNEITPPEEVQKIIDERTGMGVVGDMNKFLKYEAAKAIGKFGEGAAAGGGAGGSAAGGAAAGVGTIFGVGLGGMIPGMLYQAVKDDSDPAKQGYVLCPKCHAQVPLNARFCNSCGTQLVVINKCATAARTCRLRPSSVPSAARPLARRRNAPNAARNSPPGPNFVRNAARRRVSKAINPG